MCVYFCSQILKIAQYPFSYMFNININACVSVDMFVLLHMNMQSIALKR